MAKKIQQCKISLMEIMDESDNEQEEIQTEVTKQKEKKQVPIFGRMKDVGVDLNALHEAAEASGDEEFD